MNKRQILFLIYLFVTAGGLAQQLPADGPLTIDPKLQALGERLLQNKQGSIVAIEPATGKILALVSIDKVNDGVNRAISMEYSPGSTFKVAQTLEMLTEGTLVPEKTFPCHKGFYFDGIHIGCHPHKAPLALVQAIGQSCNSYFCKLFQEMIDNRKAYLTKYRAINRWASYMHSMGLGKPLGIDLPGEASGLIPDSAFLQRTHRSWNGTTIMWVGMGQGEVSITPIQLCNLAAMIGNRGYYITPHIHEATADKPLDEKYTVKHQCMASQKAIDIVIQGMRATIVNGTAASINTPEYKICGKTGTAENKGDDHSIFMGFAPMDNPKIAVSVYVENGGFGADLAAPLASLIIEQHLTGKLSEKSENHASKWESKKVKITPVEVPVNFDDL
ncbi:MAG: penicillin-binding protein [Prevotella sp.]|nr:penicillin-binding protein [Prevotella sp.]